MVVLMDLSLDSLKEYLKVGTLVCQKVAELVCQLVEQLVVCLVGLLVVSSVDHLVLLMVGWTVEMTAKTLVVWLDPLRAVLMVGY